MARTLKTPPRQNLLRYPVLIEDPKFNSEYFEVSELNRNFHAGKNGFLIRGSQFLKLGSQIAIEVLDRFNSPVFCTPVDNFSEGGSHAVSIEIFQKTLDGPGKLVILGTAETFSDGSSIPEEWQNKINVRWVVPIQIETSNQNTSPLRLTNEPVAIITEQDYLTLSRNRISLTSSLHTASLTYDHNVQSSDGYALVMQRHVSTDTFFDTNKSSSFVANGIFTGSLYRRIVEVSPYLDGSGNSTKTLANTTVISDHVTASVSMSLDKVLNETTAITNTPIIFGDKTDFLGSVLHSGSFVRVLETTGTKQKLEEYTSSVVYQYVSESITDSATTSSVLSFRIPFAQTSTGEISKVRVLAKESNATFTAFQPLTEFRPGERNLVTTSSLALNLIATSSNAGAFTDRNILDNNWFAADFNDADGFNQTDYESNNTASVGLTSVEHDNQTTIDHATNTDVKVGMRVTGTGIPPHATVDTVTDDTTFELSVASTADVNTGTLSLTYGIPSVTSSAQILDGVIVDNAGSTSYFFGTKNYYRLFSDVEYTLKYTAVYNPQYVSGSTTYTTTDSGSLKTFLSGVANTGFSQINCATTVNPPQHASGNPATIVIHPANSKIVAGLSVSGTGIETGTTVLRIVSPTRFELSTAASAANNPITLTFSEIASAVINNDTEPVDVGFISKYGLLVDDFKTNTTEKSLYEREVNFKVPRNGEVYIRLKPESGFWSFGNIQITPTVEKGFSPDEIIFDAPNNLLTNTENDFKIQFLNFKDEPIDYEILTSAQHISASAGTKGEDGAAGAGIVYRGDWVTSTLYYKSDTRRDVVKGSDNKYYLCKEQHTSAGDKGDPPNGNNASNYWEAFSDTFDSVATDILFSNQVYADQTINVGSSGGSPVISLHADASGNNANPYIAIGSGVDSYGDTGGIFLGYDSTTPKLSLKGNANQFMTWNGTELEISGTLTATNLTLTGTNSTLSGFSFVSPAAKSDYFEVYNTQDNAVGRWFGGSDGQGGDHTGYLRIFNDSVSTANTVTIGESGDGLATSFVRLRVYGSIVASGTVSGESGITAGPRFQATSTTPSADEYPHFYIYTDNQPRGGLYYTGLTGDTTSANSGEGVVGVAHLTVRNNDTSPVAVDALVVSGSAGVANDAFVIVNKGVGATGAGSNPDGNSDGVHGSAVVSGSWEGYRIGVPYGGTGVGNDGTGLTDHGVLVGSGATAAITALSVGTAGQLLIGKGASADPAFTTVSGDVTINSSGVTTIQANSVALTTDTTGNYVKKVTVGTGLGGAVDSEGATAALSLDAAQTVITSIYNANLKIGMTAHGSSLGEYIDFTPSGGINTVIDDVIRLNVHTQGITVTGQVSADSFNLVGLNTAAYFRATKNLSGGAQGGTSQSEAAYEAHWNGRLRGGIFWWGANAGAADLPSAVGITVNNDGDGENSQLVPGLIISGSTGNALDGQNAVHIEVMTGTHGGTIKSGSWQAGTIGTGYTTAQNQTAGAGLTAGFAVDLVQLSTKGSLAQADSVAIVDSADSNASKRVTFDDFENQIFGNVSGDATVAAGGALTIGSNAVQTGMVHDDVATELAGAGMTDTSGVLNAIGTAGAISVGPDAITLVAANTTLTSIINTSLTQIGRTVHTSTGEYITFEHADQVRIYAQGERLRAHGSGVTITGQCSADSFNLVGLSTAEYFRSTKNLTSNNLGGGSRNEAHYEAHWNNYLRGGIFWWGATNADQYEASAVGITVKNASEDPEASVLVPGLIVSGSTGTATDGQNAVHIEVMTGNHGGTIKSGSWAAKPIAQSYIADQSINEAKLQVSNGPTNGYVLTAQSGNTGGLTWAAVSGGGGGDVSATGSPVNNEIAVWTNGTTIEGDSNLKWNGSTLTVTGALTVGVNDTGHDVKFFGATASQYMLWDESRDDLIFGSDSNIGIGTTSPSEKLMIANGGNLSIGGNNAGSNGANVLIITNGTAPTTAGSGIQMWAASSGLYVVGNNSTSGINFQIQATPNVARFSINGYGAIGLGGEGDGNPSPDYGDAGQALTSAGSGAIPTWTTPGTTSADWFSHTGDPDTGLYMENDLVNLKAGGHSVIKLDYGSGTSAPRKIILNNGNNNIDLWLNDSSGVVYFFGDASTSRIGIGTTGPNKQLTIHNTTNNDYALHIRQPDQSNTAAAGHYFGADNTGTFTLAYHNNSSYSENLTVSTVGNTYIKGNLTIGGTVDGRDVATDGSKLDTIETSATADQSNAEIRTAVEAASDSNVFTDADHSKLNAIEASATADQSNAEIRTAVEAASDSNVFTDADHSKLNGIAAAAQTGTVTSIATGTGISGGTITTSGTLSVDASQTQITAVGTLSSLSLGGNMVGKSDHTTELGHYTNGLIKRIRMAQGGEVHFGDTTTSNALGLTEGAWNSFGDYDRLGLYCRNELKIYGNNNSLMFTMATGGNTIFTGDVSGIGQMSSTSLAISGIAEFGGSTQISSAGKLGVYTTGGTATAHIKAHDNGWDGGLRLESADGTQVIKLHPENGSTYGLMIDSRVYHADAISVGGAVPANGGSIFNVTAQSVEMLRVGVMAGSSKWQMHGLDGNAANPFYSFINDPNTGMWRQGTDTLSFSTAGTERIRVDASGNVGIGHLPSDQKLSVEGHIQVRSGNLFIMRNNANDNYSYIESTDTGSGINFGTAGIKMTLTSEGKLGIGVTLPSAPLHVKNPSTAAARWTAVFCSDNQDPISPQNHDNVLIQATDVPCLKILETASPHQVATLAVGDGNATLASSNTLRFYVGGSVTGNGYNGLGGTLALTIASGGAATWTGNVSGPDFIATSDIRLKNVTGPITNALSTVNKLNAIRYTWKDKEDDKEHIGFSAQEVLELVPEAVYGSEETEYGISYGKLVPVLVEAIKELTAEVEALKKKVGE
jgi:hypothetical protein